MLAKHVLCCSLGYHRKYKTSLWPPLINTILPQAGTTPFGATSARQAMRFSLLVQERSQPRDIPIANAVKNANHAQIARPSKYDCKEQAYCKNAREHWDGLRKRAFKEMIEMQGSEGIERVADQNTRYRPPAAHKFRLQNPAIDQLLVETPQQVGQQDNRRIPP